MKTTKIVTFNDTKPAQPIPDFSIKVKRFLGLYRQFFGRIPADWTYQQSQDLSSSINPLIGIIDRETYSEAVMAAILEKIATDGISANKTPTVWQIKRRYCDSVGLGHIGNTPKCAACVGLGIVFLVCARFRVAGSSKSKVYVIGNRDVQPVDAFLNTAPCACDNGRRHNWTTDDNGAKTETYTPQQRQDYMNDTFYNPLEADAFAVACTHMKAEQCHTST